MTFLADLSARSPAPASGVNAPRNHEVVWCRIVECEPTGPVERGQASPGCGNRRLTSVTDRHECLQELDIETMPRTEADSEESDREQRLVRAVGRHNRDDVIGTDDSIGNHNGHDPGLANKDACGVAIENGRHESWSKTVKLSTGIS